MVSEIEDSVQLEVKKARTQPRLKKKRNKDEELDSSNVNSDSVAINNTESLDGKMTQTNHKRAKNIPCVTSDLQDLTPHSENISKKTKHAKRSTDKKVLAGEENDSGDCAPKCGKKNGSVGAEKDDPTENKEMSDDSKKPKKPSKRQLKREKAEERESQKKEASRLEAMEKARNYVSKWKHARSEWKFEKLRQIWLMDNLLDDKAIPDQIFSTVLEYFEGCKGMAREQLAKKAMDVIRKQEENENAEDEECEKSIEYERARQLLQALPTDA